MVIGRHGVARDASVGQYRGNRREEPHGVQRRMNRERDQARFELVRRASALRLVQRHDGAEPFSFTERGDGRKAGG